MQRRLPKESSKRDDVALVEFGAEAGDEIDLVGCVGAVDEA